MSDGPHRSLPLRHAWKELAKRADKKAFDCQDVIDAIYGSEIHAPSVRRAAAQLAYSQKLSQPDAEQKLSRLLNQHAQEWRSFIRSLGPQSFISKWVSSVS